MPTPKQEKLIRLVMENYGNTDRTKSLGELMVEAGYSQESAKNPKLIFESEAVQEGISDFIGELDKKRRLALKHITEKKLKIASAKDNAMTADILTKINQLLSDKPTEINKNKEYELLSQQIAQMIENARK